MRDLLQRIRTRVDRLVAGVECDGPHVVTNVSMVPLGEPTPAWPPPDAAETCGPSPRRSDAPRADAGRGVTH